MYEIVITAVGPDRPGLVDELTRALFEQGANVADSRMVNLRGQFALLLLAQCPDEKVKPLEQALHDTGQRIGLTIHFAEHPARELEHGVGVPYVLRAYSMDQPGIVHRITAVLHQHRVNIEELQTRLNAASYSGTPLFNLTLKMSVPPSVAVRQLREQLESLADQMNCDIQLDTE